MTETPPQSGLLFTAFEPSGDAHAAPVIAELRRRHPDLPIHAWGGPLMKQAGADLVESTIGNATMGAASFAKIAEHWKINQRIKAWANANRPAVHIPVDSPAANFPICKITRRSGARVVHLVAPQLWAWGPWRARRLRRLTDLVLCILPFEEDFFRPRGIPTCFIGHPILSREDEASPSSPGDGAALPGSHPRIALLPGSRPGEIHKNFRSMLNIIELIRAAHPTAHTEIAAANEKIALLINETAATLPPQTAMSVGRLDEVLAWADVALVCSGTATLDVTKARVPMVVMYRASRWLWELVGRMVVRTPFFALPNLIAGREVVPEFVPYFGTDEHLAHAVMRLIEDDDARQTQLNALDEIIAPFTGHDPGQLAADAIEKFLD